MTFDVPRHDIKPKKGEENGAQENVAASRQSFCCVKCLAFEGSELLRTHFECIDIL